MRWILILALTGLLIALGVFPKWRSAGARGDRGIVTRPPAATARTYTEERSAIEAWRVQLAELYANSPAESRREILGQARTVLGEAISTKLAPHWLGTTWDFNGTSETPGEGGIACGYFVSTVLRDAGLRLERIRLAQQASGNIIRSLTTRQNTTRLVGKPFDEFLARLADTGPGIYVIGLDYHVGFIVQSEDGEARFVHSDGMENKCVVSEPAATAPVLKRSNWREFANITADDALIETWLRGGVIATRTGG